MGAPVRLVVIFVLCFIWQVYGEKSVSVFYPPDDTASTQLSDMSLSELMEVTVNVASRTDYTIREAPGIVSLITHEDIELSGARDLIDVLRLVPGFEFGIDVRGVTSLGIRGNWAHEGKVLLLWDGQVVNEALFQTIQLGNHYPVELIERIEIIRGPGSAIYGGNAELGVINIVTLPAASLNGAVVSVVNSRMSRSFGRQNCTFGFSRKTDEMNLDFSFFAGNANRSDAVMTDNSKDNPYHQFSMGDQSGISSYFMNAGFTYKGLRIRIISDSYHLYDRTMYGINLPSPVQVDFLSNLYSIDYSYAFSDQLQVSPRVSYSKFFPYAMEDKNYARPVYLDKWAERLVGGILVNYQPNSALNIQAGVEANKDEGHAKDSSFYMRDPAQKEISFTNIGYFAQVSLIDNIANFTAGLRYEDNSRAGSSVVPRFAVTKVINDWHFKLLYSFAFRSPGLENISRYSSKPIESEKTRVLECETGWQLSEEMNFVVNAFQEKIEKPIIFFNDTVLNAYAYQNADPISTFGLEAEYRYRNKYISAVCSYSFYKADKNNVPSYQVQQDDNLLLGLPQHKIGFSVTWFIPEKKSLNISGTWLSKRYYYATESGFDRESPSKFLLNIFYSHKDFLLEGLHLGAGVYDILNVQYQFLQPYVGTNSPMPGPTREYLIRLSYQYDFF
ncbi:MAG: TonB-dependent receptor plug domain-containing protein [Ignavibacteria bacterium]|nr:TonB-dependent receptor plug domain-containing protein [Ignavibacteria bacterium]